MELKSRWWTVPERFAFPLEFYIERDQEELIYIPGPSLSSFPCPSSLFAVILTPRPPGHLDADLLRLGAHSQTFIQRERGFAATGLTRVLLVASLESRQWLFLMVWRVSSRDPKSWGRALGKGVPSGRGGKAQEMRTGRGGGPGPVTPSRSPRGPGQPGESGLAPRSPCRPRAAAAGPGSQPLTTRDLAAAHAILLDPGACSRPTGEGAPSPLGPPRPAVTERLVADPFRVHSVHQTVLISAGQSRGEEASEERPDRQDPRWRPWCILGPLGTFWRHMEARV
ncbi:PREDICTED: putative KHDC1-like protein [Bison bison bison]|uniref:KHDC1-like protein n=1 Tax=Bison bison bison TaxID=43346 RepID=A0A6P3IF91_BISBB|nr:PREDICTED: putative KHDC1-like protein [Bison bison bison]